MRIRTALFTALSAATLAASAAASAAAQAPAGTPAPKTIDPGMTKAQVVEHLGKPSSERTRGEFTYLFFANGMEKQVGMSDVVTLQGDKVIDAIFRSPRRAYSGTSSSPRAIPANEAYKKKTDPAKGGGA